MLDENLPTFRLKASSDDPSTSILFLTQNGSDPSPEYLFRRADPTTQPASRNKYAAALCSAYAGADVVYAEVVVEPEWTQPSLSAAEIRNAGGTTPAPVPVVPDSFAVQLYDPDQTVTFKTLTSTWTKSDSWEFEMPTQSFRLPSSSALDREREDARTSPDGTTAVAASLVVPRIVFRWKRDGRLSKDMTCYLVGKNLGGGKKSKEPDITVALFKAGRDSAITIYEPNLQRVEVEDRKGLEVVLLLGAEVIRDLYLVPRQDVFNVSGGSANGGRRKNSRPSPSPPATMSGALGSATIPPQHGTAAHTARPPPPGGPSPGPNAGADIDAETRRLQAMVAQEEREREKREKAEQKRIKRMLEEEEKERRRREAEVAKETERLKKLYGVQGQDLPSSTPQLPPRRPQQSPAGALYPPPPGAGGWYGPGAPPPHLPPRPVSVGPLPQHGPGPFASGASTSWWRGPGAAGPPPPQQQMGGRTQRRGSGGGGPGLGILNPAAASSGFFSGGREDKEKRKVQKKRSMHW